MAEKRIDDSEEERGQRKRPRADNGIENRRKEGRDDYR